MLINLGRLLMLFVWAFLILNLGASLPAPAQYLRQRGVGVHGADARYATGAAEINDTERGVRR
ncbi:putative membrane protein [Salmonella enterica subsp. enterica serovar Daytona]|uniref:Putative membrane protein n=1 Tax=Salmonella enterica subsp. enterica serovar Daytona TaxID=1962639 RepID=A0A447JAS5_SALET|nr:putative membrane protein [Salmonella enterica subsp. enterica serovar Daytona]